MPMFPLFRVFHVFRGLSFLLKSVKEFWFLTIVTTLKVMFPQDNFGGNIFFLEKSIYVSYLPNISEKFSLLTSNFEVPSFVTATFAGLGNKLAFEAKKSEYAPVS